MDYGFAHDGKVYTPNATQDVDATDNDSRNKAIEAHELAAWTTCPDGVLAYYKLEADKNPFYGSHGEYRGTFTTHGTVTTWLGTQLGVVTHARVYRHNFGGRFVSVRVTGSNGAQYHGRASYDWGQCIRLRLCKPRTR